MQKFRSFCPGVKDSGRTAGAICRLQMMLKLEVTLMLELEVTLMLKLKVTLMLKLKVTLMLEQEVTLMLKLKVTLSLSKGDYTHGHKPGFDGLSLTYVIHVMAGEWDRSRSCDPEVVALIGAVG